MLGFWRKRIMHRKLVQLSVRAPRIPYGNITPKRSKQNLQTRVSCRKRRKTQKKKTHGICTRRCMYTHRTGPQDVDAVYRTLNHSPQLHWKNKFIHTPWPSFCIACLSTSASTGITIFLRARWHGPLVVGYLPSFKRLWAN